MAIKINQKLLINLTQKYPSLNSYTEMDQVFAAVNDCVFIDVTPSLRLI